MITAWETSYCPRKLLRGHRALCVFLGIIIFDNPIKAFMSPVNKSNINPAHSSVKISYQIVLRADHQAHFIKGEIKRAIMHWTRCLKDSGKKQYIMHINLDSGCVLTQASATEVSHQFCLMQPSICSGIIC